MHKHQQLINLPNTVTYAPIYARRALALTPCRGDDAGVFELSTNCPMTDVHLHSHHIATPQGMLFAQSWTPKQTHGAALVLLHDSLGCVALWRDFPLQLAQATGRTVIAYDRLGFGASAAHPSTLPTSFVADEAHQGFAAVLAHFGLHTFVALGHSVGGGMAVCCAATYPRQCQALITIAAQAFVEDRTLAGIRQAQAEFTQPGAMDRLAKYHGAKADWVLHA